MRLPRVMTTSPRPTPPPPDWQLISEGLKRFALALTGRTDDAEDLTQQTLAHLFARQPDKAAHIGYARRTMTRLWLDRERSLRRRLRRYTLVARQAASRSTSPATDSDAAALLRERIDSLPAQQRAALVLRLIENLEYEHIAEALGCTPAAVRANLHLARRSLARSLGEAP